MESEAMEGTLWKWTNYFSGWQPRWFVLENGILSYYKSQDDVNNGCKGSIKMAVCDVIVHQTDTTRLDLMIPGEAHFYVKAATPQERQQWLVALGSCKACQNSVRPALSTVTEEITEEEVKSKKSELRLYCDLLMQQVHSVKSAVTAENKGTPDVEKLDGATSLLSATCDTFIKTLDECMRMAQACTPAPGSPGILDNQIPGSPTRPSAKKTGPKGPMQRSMSVDRSGLSHKVPNIDVVRGYIPQRGSTTRISQHSFDETVGRTRIRGGNRSPSESSDPDKMLELGDPPDKTNDDSLDAGGKRQIQTFFSQMPKSFHDIKPLRDGGIPVTTFLDACRAILPIFDKLNPTAFAPVKLDIAGNVRKIQQKYSSNPQEFRTLQQIVLYEINAKQHDQSNSATTALLWLKRGLEFIKEFLLEMRADEEDLSIGANRAYGKTLKQYHSWVVRGVFALALKSVPYRKEFIEHLLPDTLRDEESEQVLEEDIKRYTEAMGDILEIITEFYMKHDLNSQEQV